MIIISAGMPKSGTAWFQALTTELIVTSGGISGCDVAARYDLGDIIKTRNATLTAMTAANLLRLRNAHLDGHTFSLKTHSAPIEPLVDMLKSGEARGTYIFRDPRDCMLSALEHGARMRVKGRHQLNFARLHTAKQALADWQAIFLPRWLMWMKTPGVIKVRYEALAADPAATMARVCKSLGLNIPLGTISAIAQTNSAEALSKNEATATQLHLNKGVSGRFRTILTAEEQTLWDDALAPWFKAMGYEMGRVQDGPRPGLARHLAKYARDFQPVWEARLAEARLAAISGAAPLAEISPPL